MCCYYTIGSDKSAKTCHICSSHEDLRQSSCFKLIMTLSFSLQEILFSRLNTFPTYIYFPDLCRQISSTNQNDLCSPWKLSAVHIHYFVRSQVNNCHVCCSPHLITPIASNLTFEMGISACILYYNCFRLKD